MYKKILVMAILSLSFLTVSCKKTTPQECVSLGYEYMSEEVETYLQVEGEMSSCLRAYKDAGWELEEAYQDFINNVKPETEHEKDKLNMLSNEWRIIKNNKQKADTTQCTYDKGTGFTMGNYYRIKYNYLGYSTVASTSLNDLELEITFKFVSDSARSFNIKKIFFIDNWKAYIRNKASVVSVIINDTVIEGPSYSRSAISKGDEVTLIFTIPMYKDKSYLARPGQYIELQLGNGDVFTFPVTRMDNKNVKSIVSTCEDIPVPYIW